MANAANIRVSVGDLVSSLQKFLEWQGELAEIRRDCTPFDAAAKLMTTMSIPLDNVSVLIGGSNAKIFVLAANRIEELERQVRLTEAGDQKYDEGWHAGYAAAVNRAIEVIEKHCDPYCGSVPENGQRVNE